MMKRVSEVHLNIWIRCNRQMAFQDKNFGRISGFPRKYKEKNSRPVQGRFKKSTNNVQEHN